MFKMHYCTRSKTRTAFLARIKGSSFASSVQFHIGDDDTSSRLDMRKALAGPHAGRHVYVCGPRGYIDAVLEAAKAEGWPDAQVHREFFAGQVDATAASDAFQVKIASTGQCIDVPQKVSVIEALAAAGIEVPTSCEQGVCGTCITRVLDGVPDHRDSYLMPEEQARNDQFTPCCSRSKTPVLVLDL
jgi:vanillate O-demethylase ferredoxin subunit